MLNHPRAYCAKGRVTRGVSWEGWGEDQRGPLRVHLETAFVEAWNVSRTATNHGLRTHDVKGILAVPCRNSCVATCHSHEGQSTRHFVFIQPALEELRCDDQEVTWRRGAPWTIFPEERNLCFVYGSIIGNRAAQFLDQLRVVPKQARTRIREAIGAESLNVLHANRHAMQRPDWLLLLTNDAWFGHTSAARQHFSVAVLRAVENRRSVVRAANTGISGFIDPGGRVLEETDLFTTAAITRPVPILKEISFYTRHGDLLGIAALVAICLGFMVKGLNNILRRIQK